MPALDSPPRRNLHTPGATSLIARLEDALHGFGLRSSPTLPEMSLHDGEQRTRAHKMDIDRLVRANIMSPWKAE